MVEDQEYDLQIVLPNSYNRQRNNYPVLMVLDGQWDTPLISSLYGQQNYDGFVPEAIIVGITWAGNNPSYDSLRKRDFIPVNYVPNSNGSADKFFNFIAYEAIPFLQKNYPIDQNRISLFGSSLGGLFTLYSYFAKPQIFDSYICASPAISANNQVIEQYIRKYDSFKSIKKRLYLTYGSEEIDLLQFNTFINNLKKRDFPSLILKSEIFDNIGHSGTKALTYLRGMQTTFARPSIKLSDKRIKQIIGKYNNIKHNQVELYQVLDQIYIKYNDLNLPLHAASENELYCKAMNLTINFFSNMNGFSLTTFGKVEMYRM
jgi:hypothetical protein